MDFAQLVLFLSPTYTKEAIQSFIDGYYDDRFLAGVQALYAAIKVSHNIGIEGSELEVTPISGLQDVQTVSDKLDALAQRLWSIVDPDHEGDVGDEKYATFGRKISTHFSEIEERMKDLPSIDERLERIERLSRTQAECANIEVDEKGTCTGPFIVHLHENDTAELVQYTREASNEVKKAIEGYTSEVANLATAIENSKHIQALNELTKKVAVAYSEWVQIARQASEEKLVLNETTSSLGAAVSLFTKIEGDFRNFFDTIPLLANDIRTINALNQRLDQIHSDFEKVLSDKSLIEATNAGARVADAVAHLHTSFKPGVDF